MSTLNQLREGLNEAWDTLVDGWQRLYRRASGAITRFTPDKKAQEDDKRAGQEIAVRSAGGGCWPRRSSTTMIRSWCVLRPPAWKSRTSTWWCSTTIWLCAAKSSSSVSEPKVVIMLPSAPTAASKGRYHSPTRWNRPRPRPTTRTVYCGSSCPRRPRVVAGPFLWTCIN